MTSQLISPDIERRILTLCGASSLVKATQIQSLWSGYGMIWRCELEGYHAQSVIVKHIHTAPKGQHPRGWATDVAHQRKLRSYQVENHWYSHQGKSCDDACRIPHLINYWQEEDEWLMVLEDLDAVGYARRVQRPRPHEIEAVINWLAHFHARFMNVDSDGLWPQGCYWHLDTRQEEWTQMTHVELKAAAKIIDELLENARYKTIVHGDAKLANFCFSDTGHEVAAVDFQYVGGGCGMKDLVYFLSSAMDANSLKHHEEEFLAYYFDQLKMALNEQGKDIDYQLLKTEWQKLYAYAWADFHRFLDGWSPGHWKMHRYSKRLTTEVLNTIHETQ